MKFPIHVIFMMLMMAAAGCTSSQPNDMTGITSIESQELVIASTTSTQDSGLFDRLNPVFEERAGATVLVVAKGTGAAIQYAVDKNADIIFVHARASEDKFVADGYGVERFDVMYNDFVIIGPKEGPAGIMGMTDAAEALTRVRDTPDAVFVSRGDGSGTHKMEMALWEKAGITPRGDRYLVTGKGMGDTLTFTDEELGYTLSDRATWIKKKDTLIGLDIVVQGPVKGGDDALMNPYGIIAVDPGYNPEANYDLAMAYIDFVTGPEGQAIIGDYTINGEHLFFPDAG